MRKRYFTQNLDFAIKSEFERTKTWDSGRRTSSLPQPARQHLNPPRVHGDMVPSPLVIRRVDTEPKPISSMDFAGTLLSNTPSQGILHDNMSHAVMLASNPHGIVHDLPLVFATGINQNHAQAPHQRLHPRELVYITQIF